MKPDFVQIPYELIENDDVRATDERLYGVIYWLAKLRDKKCTAGNKYLSEVVGVSKGTIKNSLARLEKAGYIIREYDENGKRLQVIPTVVMAGGSSNDYPQGSSDDDGVGSSYDAQNNKSSLNNSVVNSDELTRGKLVNEGIHWFKNVNESIDRVYGHKVQREAMEWLLDNYSPPKIKKFVTQALPELNGKQYFPTTTTPNQLVKKLPKIKAYFRKREDEKDSQGRDISGLNNL